MHEKYTNHYLPFRFVFRLLTKIKEKPQISNDSWLNLKIYFGIALRNFVYSRILLTQLKFNVYKFPQNTKTCLIVQIFAVNI